jgi:hypothetical membrane protein
MQKSFKKSFPPLFEWPIFCLAGFTGVLSYITFTIISILFFPSSFNWFDNYLSTLGDFYDNPNGAIFYNVGMVLTGIASILFYIGFYRWATKKDKSKLLLTSLLLGCINGFAIIMAGVFSETHETFPQHVFWSLTVFLTFFPILILMNTAFLINSNIHKIIILFGIGVALIDVFFFLAIILAGTSGTNPFLEWLSIFSYNGWALLLIVNTITTQEFQ